VRPLENTPDLKPLLSFLLVFTACYAVAFVGSLGAFHGLQSSYPDLAKPTWNPPNWLFAPVWTILYGLMAYSAWLVLQSDSPNRNLALAAFALQLAFNGLWTWLFFAWGKLGLAALELGLLWLLILLTAVLFWRIRPLAGVLLLPYLAWVAFAGCLNVAIWRMNPEGPPVKITVEPNP
jgi:tryptophan-rich sensory protein